MTFKKQLAAATPANHMVFNSGAGTTHQVQYLYNICARVAQGLGLDDRQGDAIYMEAVKLNIQLATDTVSNAYHYRIMLFYSRDEYTTLGQTYSAGILATGTPLGDMILPSQNSFTAASLITNPKCVTKVFDLVVDINSQVTGAASAKTLSLNIPLKKEFKYSTNGQYGKFKNLYLLIVPEAYGGTLATTDAGDYFFNLDLIYKNI